MRLNRADREVVEVVVSRRNLLTLLAKLDGFPRDSARTILLPGDEDQPTLVVRAESDLLHYGRRGFGPGPMHPATEAHLQARPAEDSSVRGRLSGEGEAPGADRPSDTAPPLRPRTHRRGVDG
jgi:hypothetical protein